jgi:hypothetical protein
MIFAFILHPCDDMSFRAESRNLLYLARRFGVYPRAEPALE